MARELCWRPEAHPDYFIQLYLNRNSNTLVLNISGFSMRPRSWDSSGIVVCSLFGRQLASISIIWWRIFGLYSPFTNNVGTTTLSIFTGELLGDGSQFPAKGFHIIHYHRTSLKWKLIKETFFAHDSIKKYSYCLLYFSSTLASSTNECLNAFSLITSTSLGYCRLPSSNEMIGGSPRIVEQDKKVKEKLNSPQNSTIKYEKVRCCKDCKHDTHRYYYAYNWDCDSKKKKKYIGKQLPLPTSII